MFLFVQQISYMIKKYANLGDTKGNATPTPEVEALELFA